MSWKRAALRLVGETIVGGFLSKVGEHLGDAVGNVLGRKIDPEHGKNSTDDGDDDAKPVGRRVIAHAVPSTTRFERGSSSATCVPCFGIRPTPTVRVGGGRNDAAPFSGSGVN